MATWEEYLERIKAREEAGFDLLDEDDLRLAFRAVIGEFGIPTQRTAKKLREYFGYQAATILYEEMQRAKK